MTTSADRHGRAEKSISPCAIDDAEIQRHVLLAEGMGANAVGLAASI